MHEIVLGVRSSAWSKGRSLVEQIKAIAAHGFKYVNVILRGNETEQELKEAVKVFKDLGLYAGQTGINSWPKTFSRPSDWPSGKEAVRRKIQWNAMAGGKQIGVVAGTWSVEYPFQRSWVDSVAAMQYICDEAAKEGLVVAVEYEPEIHYVTNTYWGSLEYLSQVDRDNLMINIDLGHMNCMQTPFRAVSLLRQLIPQCHITDNDGTQHHGPIGEGTTDIAGWIQTLKPLVEETCDKIGEIPAAVIEFGAPDPDAEIVRIQEHLKRIGVELPKEW
jgi:sugar phosphate isomerase/epimerase